MSAFAFVVQLLAPFDPTGLSNNALETTVHAATIAFNRFVRPSRQHPPAPPAIPHSPPHPPPPPPPPLPLPLPLP